MPLIKEFYPTKTAVIGVWQLQESIEQLEDIYLSESDKKIYQAFKIDKRKKEWLAVKHLIKKLLGDDKIQIIRDEFGKPTLENSNFKISISHSKNFVAIFLNAKSEVGIDIEEVRNQILSIVPKFMSDEEQKMLSEISKAVKATICWSAKESLYKFYAKRKVDFKANLFLSAFELLPTSKFAAKIEIGDYQKNLELNYLNEPEFVLTWVYE